MHFKLYASGKNASEELENVLQVVCIRFFRNLIEHFCCACEVRRGVVVRSEIVFSIIKRRGNACVILALRPSLLCVSYYCCMEQYTICLQSAPAKFFKALQTQQAYFYQPRSGIVMGIFCKLLLFRPCFDLCNIVLVIKTLK